MKDKIVYILGAGCSANYGYPLARNFRDALKNYEKLLADRPNCERLKQSVARTIELMDDYRSPTIDRLVVRITEEFDRQRQASGTCFLLTKKHLDLENAEQEQILHAKRATTAFFLELEANARKSGLQGYRDFFNIIFDGNRNSSVLETPPKRVLSFNYDRLFEIAFADYFRLNDNMDCYGQAWLNSGLDFLERRDVKVLPDRFCFLKLHGTTGIFAQSNMESLGIAACHLATQTRVSMTTSSGPQVRPH